jgi:uncharacterized protein YndB with AHSA1/START domain
MTLDGSVARADDGGWVVAFERFLDKPPEKVWTVLTDPQRLKNWLGDVEVDLRVGGAFVIHFRGMAVVMTGQITELKPGRAIEGDCSRRRRMPAQTDSPLPRGL